MTDGIVPIWWLVIFICWPYFDAQPQINYVKERFGDDYPRRGLLGRQRAFDAGFDGFISKPFTKDDMAAACDRFQVMIAESKALIGKAKAAVAASRELSRRSRSDFWINRHGKED